MRDLSKIFRPHSAHALGLFGIFGYTLFASAKVVYVGHLVQSLHPLLMTFLCFSITGLVFLLLARDLFLHRQEIIRKNIKSVVALNVTTMGAWIGLFIALRHIEPAINSAIAFGAGPIFTLMLVRWFRPNSKVLRAEILCGFGVLISFCVFIWSSIAGLSGVGQIGLLENIVGFSAASLSSLCVAGNTVFSKKLFDQKFTESEVLAVRFFGLVLFSGLFIWISPISITAASGHVGSILAIAIVGIILPLYFLQVGIRNTEPVEVSLLLPFTPIVVMLMQQADSRLSFSLYSFLGLIAFVLFALGGVIARSRAKEHQ